MPISSDHHVFRVSLDRRIEPQEHWSEESENWHDSGPNVVQVMTPGEYDATEYASVSRDQTRPQGRPSRSVADVRS
jgi:hypothetical protein